MVDGYPHRIWCDTSDRALIEDYEITGLAHGTPLATRGEGAVGEAGPHKLGAGISSTRRIAAFWGLRGRLRRRRRCRPCTPKYRRDSTTLRYLAQPRRPGLWAQTRS